jgi:sulfhydrogenase subunit delta
MKPRIAVFKFASRDGCQLQFLNAEDELLKLAGLVDFAYFPEARSRQLDGPYDIAFVEGSITTPDDARRIIKVREDSRYLVTIGACATAGGIQSLRNWADIEQYRRVVYPNPEFISTLSTSTPHLRARPRGLRNLGMPRRQASTVKRRALDVVQSEARAAES